LIKVIGLQSLITLGSAMDYWGHRSPRFTGMDQCCFLNDNRVHIASIVFPLGGIKGGFRGLPPQT